MSGYKTIRNMAMAAVFAFALTNVAEAQARQWTIDECMAYAAEHAHSVRQSKMEADSYRAQRLQAIGAFLPTVSASSSLQFCSGRTIDNATNTYGNYSQMYNYYGLTAALPLFRGGKLVNNMREANRRRDMSISQQESDMEKVAIDVLGACADVLYYQGLVEVSRQKLATSDSTHYQTVRQVELGLKSEADAAQTAQQSAADRYELCHNQGLLATATLTLRHLMQLADSAELTLAPLAHEVDIVAPETAHDAEDIYAAARDNNSTVAQARLESEAARYAHKSARGALMPQLTLYAGINSNYYKYLNQSGYEAEPFGDQIKNHKSQYVSAELTIPIFSGFSNSQTMRQKRNDRHIAEDKYRQALDDLKADILKAIVDCQNAEADLAQLSAKVEADSIAYRTLRRQFEEGLADALELHTAANTLAASRAATLQGQLTLMTKRRYLDYLYTGKIL